MKCNFINPQLFGVTELGALMARTSRDARGFDEIVESVSHLEPWQRAENIMKFVEYGHASILDLMEIPLRFEQITMYQAARLFQFSPRGNGQESSTRYINNNPEWDATFQQKRVGGRLDNIRENIPITAHTSVVLRQSLRDWCTVMALARWAGSSALRELEEAIDTELACVLLPNEKQYVDSYVRNLCSDTTKAGQAINARIVNLFMEDVENSQVPSVSYTNAHGIYIVEIREVVPFYILRDLNRHRNRILTAWQSPALYVPIPMSTTVAMRLVMTLDQFKYEYGTRTTSEADPAYASLYKKWANQLEEIL